MSTEGDKPAPVEGDAPKAPAPVAAESGQLPEPGKPVEAEKASEPAKAPEPGKAPDAEASADNADKGDGWQTVTSRERRDSNRGHWRGRGRGGKGSHHQGVVTTTAEIAMQVVTDARTDTKEDPGRLAAPVTNPVAAEAKAVLPVKAAPPPPPNPAALLLPRQLLLLVLLRLTPPQPPPPPPRTARGRPAMAETAEAQRLTQRDRKPQVILTRGKAQAEAVQGECARARARARARAWAWRQGLSLAGQG
ncbi:hypothetical protein CLOM_g12812 [Closterium sp. NIES-68]|nr:hypothetical protein CLOM_g12812 [Closterium sp. NIES-68]